MNTLIELGRAESATQMVHDISQLWKGFAKMNNRDVKAESEPGCGAETWQN